MDIPRPVIPTGGYTDVSIEDLNAQAQPLSTAAEAQSATFDVAHQDTVFGALERIAAKDGIFGVGAALDTQGTKLSPEEANKRYPGMQDPFRDPVTPSYAQFLSDQQGERRNLEEKIQNGPDDLVSKSRNIGAGLVAHLLDPVETGAGILTGMGAVALVGRTALGASLAARAATSTLTRVGLNAAEGAAGGLVATGLQEGANAKATIDEQREYSAADGIKNVAIGTILGGILGVGIKEATFRIKGTTGWEGALKKVEPATPGAVGEPGHITPEGPKIVEDHLPQVDEMYRQTSPEAGVAATEHAINSLEQNKNSVAHLMNEQVIRETDVNPGAFGHEPYNYAPIAQDTVVGRKFYVSASNATASLEGAELKNLGTDLGVGIQMTDNPGVANATSAPSLADNVGNVHEVTFTREPNLARMSDVVPAELLDNTNALMKKLGEAENGTLGEAINALKNAEESGAMPRGTVEFYANELRKAGYDALVSDGASRFGVDVAPHNQLTVLADDLIEHTQTFEAEAKMINQPSGEMVQKLQDHHLGEHPSMWVDEANMNKMQTVVDAMKEEMRTVSDASKLIEQDLNDMEKLHNLGELPAEDAKVYEALKKEFSLRDAMNEFQLHAMKCLGG